MCVWGGGGGGEGGEGWQCITRHEILQCLVYRWNENESVKAYK